jgi:hypothetical protein
MLYNRTLKGKTMEQNNSRGKSFLVVSIQNSKHATCPKCGRVHSRKRFFVETFFVYARIAADAFLTPQ